VALNKLTTHFILNIILGINMSNISLFSKLNIALAASLLSQVVMAHPGHDHQDPSSPLIHLLWLTPLFIAFSLIIFKVRANRKNIVNKKQEQA